MYRFKKYYNETMHDSVNTTNDFRSAKIYTTSAPISFETTNGDVANGSTLMYRFKKYYNETMHDSVNTTNNFRSAKKFWVTKVRLEELTYMANELLSESRNYENPENINVALSVETLTTRIKPEPNETFRLNLTSIYVDVQQFTSYHYTDLQMKDTEFKLEGIKALLPGSAVDKALHMSEDKRTSVSFVVFRNASFFQTSKDFAVDQVLSCSIADKKITDLLKPFWYQIPVSYEKSNETRQVKFLKCAYYDVELNDWNSDGCSYVVGSNPPNCTCNHLTNFAVLVKTANLKDPYTLEIFGKVGCSLSVIGLALMLLCICYFSSLRKNLTNQIHSNLGFSLLVAYVLFLTGVEQINNRIGCITIAAFLHLFLLSAWGWMIVECATMYKKLVSVFGSTGPHYILKAAVMVYSGSALIAVVTVAVAVGWFDRNFLMNSHGFTEEDEIHAPSTYISQRLCWLHNYSLIFGFLMPIAIALVINIFGFIAISKAITCDRSKILLKSNQKKTSLREAKTYLTRAIIFTFLLGLAWLLAIPLTISDDKNWNIVFGWLFSVANSLQGFFVFFLFCIRRKDVCDLWTTEVLKLLCITRKDSHVKGQPKIDGRPGTSTPQTKSTDVTVTYTKTNKIKV
ncbi:adhesion G-protein coupled receptor G7-like [Styela clava]